MPKNIGQSKLKRHNELQKLMGHTTGNLIPNLPALPIQNLQGDKGQSAKISPKFGFNSARRFSMGNKLELLKSYAGVSGLKPGFDPRSLLKF